MSRTLKDKPWKYKCPEQQWDYKYYANEDRYWFWYQALKKPGVLTKKKRSYEDYHGMSTPMWWIRVHMNRPQRRASRVWEAEVVKISNLEEVDMLDNPGVSRKPHIYYW